jgi:hypothetical protein
LFHLAALKKINPLFGNFSRNLDIDLFNSQDINSNIKRCIVFSNDNLGYAKCLVDNKSDMNVQDIVNNFYFIKYLVYYKAELNVQDIYG